MDFSLVLQNFVHFFQAEGLTWTTVGFGLNQSSARAWAWLWQFRLGPTSNKLGLGLSTNITVRPLSNAIRTIDFYLFVSHVLWYLSLLWPSMSWTSWWLSLMMFKLEPELISKTVAKDKWGKVVSMNNEWKWNWILGWLMPLPRSVHLTIWLRFVQRSKEMSSSIVTIKSSSYLERHLDQKWVFHLWTNASFN